MNGIPKLLKKAYNRYKAKLPQQFEWVENINRVRDLDEIRKLDLELDSEIAKGNIVNFWLGEPEIVDWESQIGYSFDLSPRTPRHVVLQIDNYIEYQNKSGANISVESFKNSTVYVNNNEYKSIKCWSAYRCLYAEISFDDNQYVLRNGVWYRVNTDFVKFVNDYLSDINAYEYTFPIYNHDKEEEYNL